MANARRRILFILAILFCLALPLGAAFAEGLSVYFLDVGQGNAAYIECDGYTMLIDGGPADASQYVYSFLKSHGVTRIDYMVATHQDADHIGGLPAVREQSVGIVFAPDATPAFDFFGDYLEEKQQHILVPEAGDTFSLGEASVTVLGPARGAVYSDNTSLVLRVVYGETSFLFVGDSEIEDENALIDSGCALGSTVLCVGHHGSSSSSAERFLERVAPQYAVISVGADNTYGHPNKNVVKRLEELNATVYRTDRDGQILFESDGETVTVTTEKGENPEGILLGSGDTVATGSSDRSLTQDETENGEAEEATYIGNKNSKKFHLPDCDAVAKMRDKNKVYFYGDREEPIAEGYIPCGGCNP